MPTLLRDDARASETNGQKLDVNPSFGPDFATISSVTGDLSDPFAKRYTAGRKTLNASNTEARNTRVALKR